MSAASVTTLQKKRRLPFGLAGDALNVIFVYLVIGGPVQALFLDSIGLNKAQIGMVFSLMPFMALIAPVFGPIAARLGIKRVFLTFWFARTVVAAALIATPWVFDDYGVRATFIYVIAVMAVFSFCRSAAETAYYPWNQEFIPPSIRGKFAAVQQVVMIVFGVVTVLAASYALGSEAEPRDFVPLFAVAVVAELASAFMFMRLPGGAPVRDEHTRAAGRHGMTKALRDKRFIRFNLAHTLVMIGASSVIPFVPLLMKEQIGLQADMVVRLEIATMGAALLSCFLWGWAIDRYGSKPVIVISVALIAMYPVILLLMPRQSAMSVPIAFAAAAYLGVLNPGWAIAFGRHLFVEMVPEEHKTGYLAIYYAWVGLVTGTTPLVAGWALERFSGLSGSFGIFAVDPYTPMLLLYVVCLLIAAVLFSHVHASKAMGARQFVGMFLQGNPFAAMHSMIAHNLAHDENARIASIERLGQAGSPLTIDELIDALNDPSFNVRQEAVVTMARMKPNDRITDALLKVVHGPELDLAILAVWALGRIGDKRAVEPLRELLLANYPLLAARAARSLGQLGDDEVKDLVLARFRDEIAPELRIAYAAALGLLHDDRAMTEVLAFLREVDHAAARRELSLAAARMIGDERYIMRLWRKVGGDRATALSEALLNLRKRVLKALGDDRAHAVRLDRAIADLSDDNLVEGIAEFAKLLGDVDDAALPPPAAAVLHHAAEAMTQFGDSRIEYVVLALHVLDAGLEK